MNKLRFLILPCMLLLAALCASAQSTQLDLPRQSQKAQIMQRIGITDVTIVYHRPLVDGRKIFGGLVPYGEVWRTGANPATTLITAANLKIGTLDVPAGTYTIYTLPSASQWLLIVNKQTGQWGTVYNKDQDLGRTPMQSKTLPAPQEKMSISFENTSGNTTELHIKWETTDEYVTIKAE